MQYSAMVREHNIKPCFTIIIWLISVTLAYCVNVNSWMPPVPRQDTAGTRALVGFWAVYVVCWQLSYVGHIDVSEVVGGVFAERQLHLAFVLSSRSLPPPTTTPHVWHGTRAHCSAVRIHGKLAF